MTLESFLAQTDSPAYSLVVVNREAPQPLQSMLEGLFADQAVAVEAAELSDESADMVYLTDGDDVVATSTLQELQEAILMVNSDLYITGAREVEEVAVPAVVERLEGVRFRLRGYPESAKEKFLLIVISRYIERLSLSDGDGTHRASFQRLSRLDDEKGTRTVYERLAASPVETHIYGQPDREPDLPGEVSVHADWGGEYRDSWFVVHVPEADDGRHAALVALEDDLHHWNGFWTFDPDRVREIDGYIAREL